MEEGRKEAIGFKEQTQKLAKNQLNSKQNKTKYVRRIKQRNHCLTFLLNTFEGGEEGREKRRKEKGAERGGKCKGRMKKNVEQGKEEAKGKNNMEDITRETEMKTRKMSRTIVQKDEGRRETKGKKNDT